MLIMRSNEFDVIIVGAGALGIFHAYYCLKAGKTVLLLEKDKKAQEATVRNFGQVVPSGHAPESRWHHYGRITTALYKEIQEEFLIGIRDNGSCYIAHTESEMAVLEEICQRFRAADYTCDLWTTDQVIRHYPAIHAAYAMGGLFFPQEVSAEPEIMIHKMLEYLTIRFKGQFTARNSCAVIDVLEKQGGCEVITADRSRYTAAHCLICSGRDFKLLFPEIFAQSGLVVSKLNMMAAVPQSGISLPGNILTGLTIRRYESFTTCAAYRQLDPADVPEDCSRYGIHILFKQRVDGSIIIGDSHEYAEITDQDSLGQFYNEMAINDIILREARKIIQLENWKMSQHWTGFYCQHKDGIFVHRITPGIHIVTGIGGKGMTTAAGFAQANTDRLILGK